MNTGIHGAVRCAAVFATMNRREAALGCVRALAAQTVPPVLVVVADNGSADGSVGALEGLAGLPFALHVHRMGENRGNAGGVEEAMALALQMGAEAVWVLDDDSWPRPEAMAGLLAGGLSGSVVRHPFQVDPTTGRLAWPVPLKDGGGNWRMVGALEELPAGTVWESRPSWTGALIPREIIERVGPVDGALFIRGEDDEYSFRIAATGVRYEVVKAAVLDHPGPARLLGFGFPGKRFFWEPGLAEWKLYYKVRNAVWLRRKSGAAVAAMGTLAASVWASVLYDRWSWHRWRVLARAARDGWTGKLGRIEAPWAP